MITGTRGRLVSAILGAVLMTLASPQPSRAQESGVVARNIKAQDFLNTFGVNIHFHENGYKNVQAIADALNRIGFSRVRGSCQSEEDITAWNALAARSAAYFPSGLKANVLITGYLNAPDVTFAGQKPLILRIARSIESIEGPNEINNRGVGNGTHGPFDASDQTDAWPANSTAWAKAIYDWKKSVASLSPAALFAPTIATGDPSDYARLPDISAYVDAGNMHFYAGNGRQPAGFGGGNFAAIYDWYRAAATPGKPVVMSEWGQTTAGRAGQGGCDSSTQAKYILNQMFDAAARGVHRAYLYQLMDDTPDGDPTGNGGTEAHFGIFDYRWGAKPAARALANVKNLLRDTSTHFTAKVPAYRVSGVSNAGAAGSSLSISKSDGSTFIVVWNEPRIWDPTANASVTPPPDSVTVNFGGDYLYKVYDPLIGTQVVMAGKGSQIRVNVVGSPLMIRIIPATAAAPKLR